MLGKPSGHGRRPVCWVRMLLHVPLWLVRLLQPQTHSVCWQASMTCFSQPPAKTFPLFLPFYFMSWLQSQAYVLFYEWRINALVKKIQVQWLCSSSVWGVPAIQLPLWKEACSGTSGYYRDSLWAETVKTVEHRKKMLSFQDSGENEGAAVYVKRFSERHFLLALTLRGLLTGTHVYSSFRNIRIG